MAVLGLHCCGLVVGFSLVLVNRGYSLFAVRGLLIAEASLVMEHRLWGTRASVVLAPGLWSTGSIVVAHRCSCIWDIPRSEMEPVLPTLAGGFFTTGPPGSPWMSF